MNSMAKDAGLPDPDQRRRGKRQSSGPHKPGGSPALQDGERSRWSAYARSIQPLWRGADVGPHAHADIQAH